LNRSYDLTTDEQEKENMKWQLVSLVEMLECLPVTIFALDNVEADDVIAYLSQLVTADGGDSIIYSTDKDFFQLAAENIKIYNPIKKKTFSDQVILEDYGIHPKHFHFFRALDGDKSNKYANIKKVPKMIENILNNEDIIERNITLMNLHESIMSIDAKMKVVNRFQTTSTSLRKVDLTKLMMRSRLLGSFSNYDDWLAQNFIPLSRFHTG
jgi:5'-3' exonuclease